MSCIRTRTRQGDPCTDRSSFTPTDFRTEALPLLVTEIGETFWRGGEHVARSRSDVVAIEWVISGRLTYQCAGATHVVGPGQVFLLRAGEDHRYGSPDGPLHKRYIGLGGEWSRILVGGMPPVLSDVDMALLQRSFLRLRRILAAPGPGQGVQMAGIAYHLLASLLVSAQARPAESADPLLAQAVVILGKGQGGSPDIAALARSLGLSRSQLHRRFLNGLGTTPLRFWLERQMRQAQGLLAGTGLGCNAIATRLGYHDPLYFSAVFKRVTGESPSSFRRRHR